jgi:hypothetical protein
MIKTLIIIYLLVNSVAAIMYSDDTSETWLKKFAYALWTATMAIPMLIIIGVIDASKWLSVLFQLRTYWAYWFDRKSMKSSRETMVRMNDSALLMAKAKPGIRSAMVIRAMKMFNEVNNYTHELRAEGEGDQE